MDNVWNGFGLLKLHVIAVYAYSLGSGQTNGLAVSMVRTREPNWGLGPTWLRAKRIVWQNEWEDNRLCLETAMIGHYKPTIMGKKHRVKASTVLDEWPKLLHWAEKKFENWAVVSAIPRSIHETTRLCSARLPRRRHYREWTEPKYWYFALHYLLSTVLSLLTLTDKWSDRVLLQL